ncbi:MAG: VWA-like domain-containing protein, partial [Bacteroidales bacterium]|nr:VWA-like domain-containing protein [Bacteroidales bacterium]
FTTRLLIAVDVSGSISDKEISLFYSVINRFFKYGIQSIDVIQFDTEVKGAPISMKKAQKSITVRGRGGTNFHSAIDYFAKFHKLYDGMIILTDGDAPLPMVSLSQARKMLWICNNQGSFERHYEWMRKIGRCCWIEEDWI